MTPAEICTLSQASLDRIRVLKQSFDAALDVLAVSGSKEDLRPVEALQKQIETELRFPLIARSIEQMNDKTLIYIGPLETGIFKKLPRSIEHVYTRFPEGELLFESLQIGDQTSQEFQELILKSGVGLDDDITFMMDTPAFQSSQRPEHIDIVKLRVSDLGLGSKLTTSQIYARVLELGLELCPPAVGPAYWLKYKDQPLDELVFVGMQPLLNRSKNWLCIFNIESFSEGLWLQASSGEQDDEWPDHCQFLFRLRRDT